MVSELEPRHDPRTRWAAGPPQDLDARIRYAQALAESGLLPKAYQRNPPNVLLALELGDALGLRPAQALYQLHVIDGRPTPSAQLAAALTRRAGHRFRLSGDDEAATATIVRADDPGHLWSVTWTVDRARRAGLLDGDDDKPNWARHPGTMLKRRATLEVVRDACPEVLAGLASEAEEAYVLAELPGDSVGEDAVTPGVVLVPPGVTAGQEQELRDLFEAAGITDRDHRLAYVRDTVGRQVAASADLTAAEAGALIASLREQSTTEQTGQG